VHVLRNAIGHGIEKPGERSARESPRGRRWSCGREQRGGSVEIVVADDGRGVSKKILAQAKKDRLARERARPGGVLHGDEHRPLGRGVGLDAVKAHVESFGGTLEAFRRAPGLGNADRAVLPLALALARGVASSNAAAGFGSRSGRSRGNRGDER